MTADLYRQLKRQLCTSLGESEASAVAFWLLEDEAGLSKTDVLMGRADTLSPEQTDRLCSMARRIAMGEPVQYVLGHTDFCNLRIQVAPGVLIPRPETEGLVRLGLSMLRPRRSASETSCPPMLRPRRSQHSLRILDLCTGSGCIALALKHACPDATVEGWDLSDDALRIARANAEALGLDVGFRKADVLNPQTSTSDRQEAELCLIVSNPPYVCEGERADMEARVLDHEPSMALFVPDDDALRFYRALARWGVVMPAATTLVAVEINRRFGNDVVAVFREHGYSDVQLHQDSYGNDRYVQATYLHGTN